MSSRRTPTPNASVTLACPACQLAFAAQLALTWEIAGKDSDFCPQYTGDNPMPAFLNVCPSCGFVGFEADYRLTVEEERLSALRTALRSFGFTRGQMLGGAERYRRAAVLAVYLGKSNADIANLYLQATWCSRLEGEDDSIETRARRKAVTYFEKALAAGEIADPDLPVVYYLLSELYRRLGKTAAARQALAQFRQFPDVEGWLQVMSTHLSLSLGHDDRPSVD